MLSIKEVETTLSNKKAVLTFVRLDLNRQRRELEKLDSKIATYVSAINLLKICLDECIRSKGDIEEIVQGALRDAFDAPYTFVLEPVVEDEVTKGVNPIFISPDGVVCDPMEDSGASLISIGSMFLQIAILLIANKTKPLLVMDEYLTTVKLERWRKIGKILEKLVQDTPLRIVFFTHSTEPFGTVLKVEMKNGISRVYSPETV